MSGPLRIPDGKVIAIDTETTGLDPYQGDRAFAVALCNDKGETGYGEWPVDPETREVLADPEDLKTLRRFLANPRIAKVFHNANFDLGMLKVGLGLPVRGAIHDTMLAMHSFNSAEESLSLKALKRKYCGEERTDVDELHTATVHARRIAVSRGWALADQVQADYWLPRVVDPQDRTCETYALVDVQDTMQLWLCFRELMEKDETLQATYELERALRPLLFEMEHRGIAFDPAVNRHELRRHRRLMKEALATLRQIADDPEFNPNSAAQVRALLHEKLGLPVLERTENGNARTGQDILAAYPHVPAIRALLDYRASSKAANSFFAVFQQKAVEDPLVPGGYCLHPRYRQAGKRTARLSSAGPNFQGIADPGSSRSEAPIAARSPFGPRPGYCWISADYSQLEARIFAALCGEELLLKAFASGRDLHAETTNRAWGGPDNPRAIAAAKVSLDIDSDEIAEARLAEFNYDIVALDASLDKKTWRSRGKAIFFSRIMGGGWRSICRELRCTESEAREFIRAFDTAVPGIATFLKRCERHAFRSGYVQTLFGRDLRMKADECWKAGPYRVQGSAADLIKRRMLAIDEFFRNEGLDAHIALTIHDELIFEIRQDLVTDTLLRSIRRIMEDHEGRVEIDLPVELHLIGKSWAEKEKIELPRLRNRVRIRRRSPQ